MVETGLTVGKARSVFGPDGELNDPEIAERAGEVVADLVSHCERAKVAA